MRLWHKSRNLRLTLLNACLAGAIKLYYKLCDWGLILIDTCLAGAVAVLLSLGVIKLLIHIDPSFVLKDLAFVVPAVIVLVGWYTTARLNHKNEIAKRRLDCRLKILNDFIPIAATLFKYATNPKYRGKNPFDEQEGLIDKFEKSQIDFHTYGYKNEIQMIDDFVRALIPKPDLSKFNAAWNKTVPGVRKKIREELEIEKMPIKHKKTPKASVNNSTG